MVGRHAVFHQRLSNGPCWLQTSRSGRLCTERHEQPSDTANSLKAKESPQEAESRCTWKKPRRRLLHFISIKTCCAHHPEAGAQRVAAVADAAQAQRPRAGMRQVQRLPVSVLSAQRHQRPAQ